MNECTAVRDASAGTELQRPTVWDEPTAVAFAQAGDEAGFEWLYAKYHAAFYNFIYRLMESPHDADDLTADAFLKMWLALPKTSDDLRFGAWGYRVCTNVCLDTLRHRKLVKWTPWDSFISVFHPSQVADPKDSPERGAVRREDAEEVEMLLAGLPPRSRTCLVLREYFDLSYDEIAAALTTTRAAVKCILFRARDEFRQLYERAERQPGRPRDAAAPARPRYRGTVTARPAETPRTWGVSYDRSWYARPWRAEPYDATRKRTTLLGRFATAEEAQAAVDAWKAERAQEAA